MLTLGCELFGAAGVMGIMSGVSGWPAWPTLTALSGVAGTACSTIWLTFRKERWAQAAR